jgi:WD40 repeat protein
VSEKPPTVPASKTARHPRERRGPAPAAEGTDVFISYAREDRAFVETLRAALERLDLDVWWDGLIPEGVPDWEAEVRSQIDAACAAVFVVTPDSLASREVGWELAHADGHGKRILPLIHRQVPERAMPRALRGPQWIICRRADELEAAAAAIARAVRTDPEWVRLHTRLLQRALEWREGHDDRSLLLRGRELRRIEQSITAGDAPREPRLVPLQRQFIVASARASRWRLGLVAGASVCAVAVAGGLAALALIERSHAVASEHRAESRALAATAVAQLPVDPQLAGLLAARASAIAPTAEARDAFRQAAIRAAGGGINRAVSSLDGHYVLALRQNGLAELWDATTKRILTPSIQTPTALIAGAVAPGGRLVLTVDASQHATLWRRSRGTWRRRSLRIGRRLASVDSAVFGSGGRRLATGSLDGSVRLWSTARPENSTPLGTGGGSRVTALAFDRSGTRLAAGHANGAIRVVRLRAGAPARAYPGGVAWRQAGPVGAIGFGRSTQAAGWPREGRPLLTTADGGSAKIWDLETGRLVSETASDGRRTLSNASFSPDSEWLLTAQHGGEIRMWQATPGRCIRQPEHLPEAEGAVFTDDYSIAVENRDVMSIWAWKAVGVTTSRLEDPAPVAGLSVDRSGRYVLVGSGSGRLGVNQLIRRAPGHRRVARVVTANEVRDAVFGASGDLVAVDYSSGRLGLWRWRRGSKVLFVDDPGLAVDVAIGPRDRSVATADLDGRVRLWDARTGRLMASMNHGAPVVRVAFGRGGRLLSAGADGIVRLWYPGSVHASVALPQGDAVGVAAFSPDGRRIVSASADGVAKVWSTSSGGQIARLEHDGPVTAAAFDGSGKRILTASADGTARVWDVVTGQLLAELSGSAPVANASFDPSGARVAVASGTRVRVWDWRRNSVQRALTHGGTVTGVTFSRDGRLLLTASRDGNVRVWFRQRGGRYSARAAPSARGAFSPAVRPGFGPASGDVPAAPAAPPPRRGGRAASASPPPAPVVIAG